MLLSASHHSCVSEMLILTAFLAARIRANVRRKRRQQADQRHATFADPQSDFLTVLNLWNSVRRAERGAVRQPATQMVSRELSLVPANARMAGTAASAWRSDRGTQIAGSTRHLPSTPICIRPSSPAFWGTSACLMKSASTRGHAALDSLLHPEHRWPQSHRNGWSPQILWRPRDFMRGWSPRSNRNG